MGVLVVVMAFGLASPTRADESKRRELKDAIERLLSDMASELRDVPGDSSASDVDRTMEYASQVSSKSKEIKDHAEGDSDAKTMGDYYEGYASKYIDAARYLKELKNNQKALDEYPRQCEDKSKELTEKVWRFVQDDDPRGLDEIPKLAREYGRFGQEVLQKAERLKTDMYAYADRADDFSESHGKWSDVRSNLVSAVRAIYEYLDRRYQYLKEDRVCGNLAKELEHPAVKEALSKLLQGGKAREMLLEQIDKQLGEIAGYLNDLEGDSSASDVDNAERKLDEVDRSLEQLDRTKGKDDRAAKAAEGWRNQARTLREKLKALRTLKLGQYLIDRAEEKCKEAEAKLDETIRKYIDKRDPKGIKEIPMRARAVGEAIKAALDKAQEQDNVMKSARDAARFEGSEGRWREVASNMKDSIDGIWAYWEKALQVAHKSCDELAKGEEHKDVKKAVEDLSRKRSDTANELDRIKADHKKWYEDLAEVRTWWKQDVAAVRESMCQASESPGDAEFDDEAEDKIQDAANQMKRRIEDRWKELQSRGQALVARLEKVEDEKEDDEAREGAAKLKKELVKTMASVQRFLETEGLGAGMNNPRVRTPVEVGKNEHKRIQADSGKCTAAEVEVGSYRMDCVKVDSATCYIVEIKPNNDKAKNKGYKQLKDYTSAVKSYASGKKKKDDFSGKMEVFRACFDEQSEKLNLGDPYLILYEFCPEAGKLFDDFVDGDR